MSVFTERGGLASNGRALEILGEATSCTTCGFELWLPVASLEVSDVGLYDDERFPGRLLVVLREHFEHLDEVPEGLAEAHMRDVRLCARVLRRAMDAHRVNFAVLGNQESHVHAHLIPRKPTTEPMPRNSPWQDTRPRYGMPDPIRKAVLNLLVEEFRTA